MTRPAAAKLLHLGQGVCEYAVMLPRGQRGQAARVAAALKAALPDTETVATWRQVLPMVNAYLEMMNAWTLIWFVVVFIAMGFGIVKHHAHRRSLSGCANSACSRPLEPVRPGSYGDVLTEAFLVLVMGMAAGSALGVATTAWMARVGLDLSAPGRGGGIRRHEPNGLSFALHRRSDGGQCGGAGVGNAHSVFIRPSRRRGLRPSKPWAIFDIGPFTKPSGIRPCKGVSAQYNTKHRHPIQREKPISCGASGEQRPERSPKP